MSPKTKTKNSNQPCAPDRNQADDVTSVMGDEYHSKGGEPEAVTSPK